MAGNARVPWVSTSENSSCSQMQQPRWLWSPWERSWPPVLQLQCCKASALCNWITFSKVEIELGYLKHGLWPWIYSMWDYFLALRFMYRGIRPQLIFRWTAGCWATEPVSAVTTVRYCRQSLPQVRLAYKQFRVITSSHANRLRADSWWR